MAEDRSWDLPESAATPESVWYTRRRLLTALGGLASVAAAGGIGYQLYRGTDKQILDAGKQPIDAQRDSSEPTTAAEFANADRPETKLEAFARYVNYYEFSPIKAGTWRKAALLPTSPWEIAVGGLVENPCTMSVDDLVKKFGREQRVYRHRCVETWAAVVPWIGVPLRKLVAHVRPTSNAKYVAFRTADIQKLTGVAPPGGFTWPYREAVTLAEANCELAFLATGAYGAPLLKQNGAPVRLVLPWKYGFKSAKSLASIEFVEKRPTTFWNDAAPHEYGFYANVDPAVDHPRWSQKTEWMIDTQERHPTVKYNGYGKWASALYRGDEV
jgi:sulfoxide reductase catalytic subunit YedY